MSQNKTNNVKKEQPKELNKGKKRWEYTEEKEKKDKQATEMKVRTLGVQLTSYFCRSMQQVWLQHASWWIKL